MKERLYIRIPKKRTQIIANTIDSYSTTVAYLNEQIGDLPLASIDNPGAKVLIATMKSAVKDGRRRFSDSHDMLVPTENAIQRFHQCNIVTSRSTLATILIRQGHFLA